MNPTKFNNLSAEDAAVILELSPILNIAFAERLKKGCDRKFYIETTRGEKRLLSIKDMEHRDWLEGGDFRIYEYVSAAGIYASRPVSKGAFSYGTYQLYTWLDGEDLIENLPHMNHAEQYSVGKKAGAFLRNLHTLPPMYDTEPWRIRYWHKVQNKIQSYNDKPIKSRSGDLLVRYLQNNQELLDTRPQTFTHGDWNTENFILSPDGQIGLIDLGSICNDPWWDFWQIPDDLNSSPHFYTGQIKGYFDGEPPPEFFPLLAYYVTFDALESLCDFSEEGIPERVKIVLNWFDDMRNPVPAWYLSQIDKRSE